MQEKGHVGAKQLLLLLGSDVLASDAVPHRCSHRGAVLPCFHTPLQLTRLRWRMGGVGVCRIRPDMEMHYDGVSITPYETVFVPVNEGGTANKWAQVRMANKYQEWMDLQVSWGGWGPSAACLAASP